MFLLGEILDKALEANLELQRKMISNRQNLLPHYWTREFATVVLNYGRQTGKTSSIAARATSADLVILHNTMMVNDFNAQLFWKPTLTSIKNLENDMFRGKKFDRLWVDNASYMKKSDIDNVYVMALITGTKQVILIG